MIERVPLVALVGRPNVGKSTLFNRLVGKRLALVDDQPGVTRDRLFAEARWDQRLFRVVDTGGIDVDKNDPILTRVRTQTQLAIEEADLVVLVLDAEAGVMPADRAVADMLRKANKPTIVVGNKTDLPQHDERVLALYELGLDPVYPVSAEHARGLDPLIEDILGRTNAPLAEEMDLYDKPILLNADETEEPEDAPPTRIEWEGGPVRVAVVGRPNAGKSSLINRLLGEERHLASDMPGTTRDSIDSELEHEGQQYIFTDTAGIRRKRSISERLEKFAVMMAMRSLDGADVALVVLDASQPPSDQDTRIIAMTEDRGKGAIIVANKWDLVPAEQQQAWLESVERQMPQFAAYAPLIRVSAKTGRGMDMLLNHVIEVQRERHRRIGTGELNRFFKAVVNDSPPPVSRGKRPRLYFVSQPLVRPPTFVFTSSEPADIRESYTRYLINALRKRYGFGGTPLWVKFRGKKPGA